MDIPVKKMRIKPWKNLAAKIIALIAACVLWLHVATEQEFEHTFKYPLVIEGLPDEYVLGAPLPDSVTVVLSGNGKNLIKLLFSDGDAVIDASGFKYSERFLEPGNIDLKLPEIEYNFVEYIRKEPIRLLIDRYANREVPVRSSLYLEAAEGYAAIEDKIRFNPAEVVIGGPENLIRAIECVYTEQETLRDLNTTTTTVVGIQKENSLISYTQDNVSAEITVESLHQTTFEGIRVQIKSGKPQKNERLSPETIDLIFTGTKAQIDSLSREKIQVFVDYVDVGTQGNRVRPVVIHPPGVSVVSLNPEYFTFVGE